MRAFHLQRKFHKIQQRLLKFETVRQYIGGEPLLLELSKILILLRFDLVDLWLLIF